MTKDFPGKTATTIARRVLAAVLVSTLLASMTAEAAPRRRGDDEATARAKAYFKAAETAYALGRFEEALDGYSKAYEAKRLPALLFNIGQCELELGNFERAIFFYEQFLRGEADAKTRLLAERRLREARAAQAAADEKRAAEDARERERQQLAMRVEEQSKLAATQQAELDHARLRATTAPPPESTPIYERWWFWTAAAGVVAVAVTTAVLVTRDGPTVLPQGDLAPIDIRTNR